MRVRKLQMLRQTIELCAATVIWKDLTAERRGVILSKFVADKEKIERMANCIDIPTHSHQFRLASGERLDKEDSCMVCNRTRATIDDEILRTGLGKNLSDFIQAVLVAKSKPVIVTEERVTSAHNEMRHAPWDITMRQVRALSINRAKFLNVEHISQGNPAYPKGGAMEVFLEKKE